MWNVRTTSTFDEWFDAQDDTDRANVLAALIVLREKGPSLSRPYADTIKGSTHKNMKELRIQSKGNPIRAFFAFDPDRAAILLCAGDKSGKDKRFYERMISLADKEFTAHLKTLSER
ncbi:MAG: type II toxin-antitoxin system RelE/ParE family toxin [Idiomarina sp.]|nr:type II toxin-antitoxin system RelE/ParE family toxin [Idiomarina sp.]